MFRAKEVPARVSEKGRGTATTLESATRNMAGSYACKLPSLLLASCSSTLHCLQENVFQCVAAEIQATDAHLLLGGDPKDVAQGLDSVGQDHLHAVCGDGALTTHLLDGRREVTIRSVDFFELDETFVGAALLIEIGVMRRSAPA